MGMSRSLCEEQGTGKRDLNEKCFILAFVASPLYICIPDTVLWGLSQKVSSGRSHRNKTSLARASAARGVDREASTILETETYVQKLSRFSLWDFRISLREKIPFCCPGWMVGTLSHIPKHFGQIPSLNCRFDPNWGATN